MQTVLVSPQAESAFAQRSYPIYVGVPLFSEPSPYTQNVLSTLKSQQVLVVSNPNVWQRYGESLLQNLSSFSSNTTILSHLISDGEQFKTWESLEGILQALLSHHFDRSCTLIALGGGVVGDITGFAAAIYLRGVNVIQIPTTLLSQVDSSVGGKTAINHPLGKNMIGAFWQPHAVWIDVNTLSTLPDREMSAGLAEIIKHGLIKDKSYFDLVVKHMDAVFQKENSTLIDIIQQSCQIKADVVMKDETEQGIRAHLNFGHTFGHAIELGLGFGHWLHGEAVGCGMYLAAELSVSQGTLSTAEAQQIKAAIQQAKLPTQPPAWSFEQWKNLFLHDKKVKDGTIAFVLLDGIGKAYTSPVEDSVLEATLSRCGAISS
jgi:3-dehydroquinate synthase